MCESETTFTRSSAFAAIILHNELLPRTPSRLQPGVWQFALRIGQKAVPTSSQKTRN